MELKDIEGMEKVKRFFNKLFYGLVVTLLWAVIIGFFVVFYLLDKWRW